MSQSLKRKRQEVIDQIAALPPMRRGSLVAVSPKRKRKDGTVVKRGPYWRYTRKDQGKTVGRHIGEEALAEVYRSQIEAFRDYQALSAELVQISERMADEEAIE